MPARRLYRVMVTRLYSHPIYLEHITPPGHPERPDRLRAIERVLEDERFAALDRVQAPEGDPATILYAHPNPSWTRSARSIPDTGIARRCRHYRQPEKLAGGDHRDWRRQCRGGRRVLRPRRQRLRRLAPARPPCREDDRDGLLPVQQRRDRRPPRAEGAWRRARRHRRLGRPPRQRHAGHLLGRPERALLLDPSDAALSRHRREGRNRRRQHRQRAARAAHRQRHLSRCLPVARPAGCRTISRPT